MTLEFRQPTVNEAVDWLMQSMTREYRRICLDDWCSKYGEKFASQVQEQFLTRWKGKK
jgi:hypothetical protein